MILKKCRDTIVVYWNRLENFLGTTKVQHWLGRETIFNWKYWIFALRMENFMKIHKKTLEAHDFAFISQTTCRMMIPITSEHRYDPWQVFWYLGCVLEPRRKIFRVDWSRLVFSFSSIFGVLLMNSSQNPLENPSEPFWTPKQIP